MDCWGYLGRRCTGSHGIPSGTRYDCKGVIGVGGELTAESTALQQIGDDSKIGEQQPERRNCKRLCRPQNPAQNGAKVQHAASYICLLTSIGVPCSQSDVKERPCNCYIRHLCQNVITWMMT